MNAAEIFRGAGLSQEELDHIEAGFKEVNYEKGDVILDIGDAVKHQYYVQSGCLRVFFIDKKGREHTLQFAVKDWWASDYTAYFTGGIAIMSIECIQDAVLYQTSRSTMESLFQEFPRLESFFRKKLERAFATFQKRILSNLANSAQERYLAFLEDYPQVERHVKNYHIASYLGVTTETLSRIRNEIAKTAEKE
ncbi:Crp/Fnr family transcriptional regulator [Neolewinella agarilytica]|uniref:cAMP-binding domain of CRP or a regulatory subunit of cAMP-dependent protein kinases n=1 Tax=Neolewinella agarilytica TaxID=478744 RepID=A0A1H9HVM3_9BACT|nr:Crp/Fnr family transcriptional regulator [Neolewinella agarilytica]SEQ66394.1 cAMP-binding domain of CRP or a regulatory subunit of cAMP-dependent protein kinases [Neolewinella agarilytica]